MQRAQLLPARPSLQYSPAAAATFQKAPLLVRRRPLLPCKAAKNSSDDQDDSLTGKAGPRSSGAAGSAEQGPLPLLGSPISTNNISSSDAASTSAQSATSSSNGVDSRAEPSKGVSAVQNFPLKRPAQQRKQLDVNRAVQLLKLTTWRSDKKSTSKLPPYMMRTRDSESPDVPSTSSSTSTGAGTSRGKPLAAIDTLDDITADENSSTDVVDSSSSVGSAVGSRWRSSSPAGSYESSSGSRGRRMYSASDPIRRPRSRQGKSEWALLPWQVCDSCHGWLCVWLLYAGGLAAAYKQQECCAGQSSMTRLRAACHEGM